MDYSAILYEQEDDIVIITLNRPEVLNAMSGVMMDELRNALERAERDPSARCIVLTGAGNAFSAGADIAHRSESGEANDPVQVWAADLLERWQKWDLAHTRGLQDIFYMATPVIAAVNGWCLAAGFMQAIACDITIASDRAVFGQPEVRHVANTTFLFAALCGWKVANRYALTGDHIDAQEALRIGLVSEVVPHDELMGKAKALAHRIAKVPEPAVRLNKYITTLGLEAMGLHSGRIVNALLSAMVHSSHDAFQQELFDVRKTEGLKAFLKKRDDPFLPEPFGPRSKEGPGG